MAKGLFIKSAIGFTPGDDDARKMEKRYGAGQFAYLSDTSERSVLQNRLFHALCKVVFENTDKFSSETEVKDSCKLAVGHTRTTHVKYQGEWYERKAPRSITELGHDDFNGFVERSIDYFSEELGVDRDILLRETQS